MAGDPYESPKAPLERPDRPGSLLDPLSVVALGIAGFGLALSFVGTPLVGLTGGALGLVALYRSDTRDEKPSPLAALACLLSAIQVGVLLLAL